MISDVIWQKCHVYGENKRVNIEGEDMGHLIRVRDDVRRSFVCGPCQGLKANCHLDFKVECPICHESRTARAASDIEEDLETIKKDVIEHYVCQPCHDDPDNQEKIQKFFKGEV